MIFYKEYKNMRSALFSIANKIKPQRNFFTIVHAWERGIRLNFGEYRATLQPGIRLDLPFYHEVYKINMADRVQHLRPQSLISKDNVVLEVHSSIQYKVVDPKKALIHVTNLDTIIIDRTLMELRSKLSQLEVNEILYDMKDTTEQVKEKLKYIEDDWGIKILNIQLNDIHFDESMTRAMAVKAEADRNVQAKIINAKADYETAKIYAESSKIYNENPTSLRLREYQLWHSVSKNPNNTIFVVPSNVLDFQKKLK